MVAAAYICTIDQGIDWQTARTRLQRSVTRKLFCVRHCYKQSNDGSWGIRTAETVISDKRLSVSDIVTA
jgi:hypothetical protein